MTRRLSTIRIVGMATAVAVCGLCAASRTRAQGASASVPLVQELAIVQTLHEGDFDRESVVRLMEVSPAGVRYRWAFVEVHADGDTVRETHDRFVRAADLDTAPRWHEYYEPGEALEHPGTTAFTLSRAVFDRLQVSGTALLSILGWSDGPEHSLAALGFGGGRPVVVRWRGTLVRVGAGPEPFPLLIDGRRVQVPALRLRGDFTARGEQWRPEVWVLAQRDHPLLLRISDARRTFQTTRVDIGAERTRRVDLEDALSRSCRVEVPGIYFDFNSAALAPASDASIEALAAVLLAHETWHPTVEGHTDSIGTAASNQLLSQRRAEAVRDRLARFGVPFARLRAVGYGAARPREPNTTIEGRARNRRVELVRQCGEGEQR